MSYPRGLHPRLYAGAPGRRERQQRHPRERRHLKGEGASKERRHLRETEVPGERGLPRERGQQRAL